MIVLFIILGAVILGLVIIYNNLIAKKNQLSNAFSSIDVLLKKRYDLIPNLISTVKTYMKHEAGVLNDITELRTKALSGVNDNESIEINNKISKAISGLMVSVENYPDLKASENFKHLQGSLNEIEGQISAARRAYNAAVTDLNNAIEMFPSSIIASMLSYKKSTWIEIPEAEKENVNVSKLFDEIK